MAYATPNKSAVTPEMIAPKAYPKSRQSLNVPIRSALCLGLVACAIVDYDYEKMPEFPSGINELMQYLATELVYPNKSRRKGIEGLVLVGFMVNTDGSISGIKIIKSVNAELDAEAMRVVKKMPKWKPGMQDGEAITVSFTLPIKYRLQ